MAGTKSKALREMEKLIEKAQCALCELPRTSNKICACGASTCSDCCEKRKTCRKCKRKTPTVEHDFLNYVVKTAKKECVNILQGCRITGTTYYLTEHIVDCEYRKIACPIGIACEGIEFSVLFDHMTNKHKAEMAEVNKKKASARVTITVHHGGGSRRYYASEPALMRIHGHTFMSYSFKSNGFMVFNLVMIGVKSDARKFEGIIKVNPGGKNSHKFKFPMESAVEHCVCPHDRTEDTKYDHSISLGSLAKYAKNFGDKSMQLEVKYRVKKLK